MQPQTQHYRQILQSFLDYLQVMGYAPHNMTGAKEFLRVLEQQGVRDLAQVKASHIKDHYAHLQIRPCKYGDVLSPHTINGYLYDIRQLLRWAEKTGQIIASPMAAMRFPTPPRSERAILTKKEIQQLYRTCNEPVERLTLGLFYGCGLRASEGAKLNLDDVNAKAQLLYVRQGKGKKRRVIPLTKSIIEDIENYVQRQRPSQESRHTIGSHKQALALGRYGRRFQANSYRMVFRKLLVRNENIRQNISLHNLRHSIATHLLADGMRIERVRDFLGHDCLETTQIYTRVNTQLL